MLLIFRKYANYYSKSNKLSSVDLFVLCYFLYVIPV